MTDPKLIPCPKCNGVMKLRLFDDGYHGQLYQAECVCCGLSSGISDRETIIRNWREPITGKEEKLVEFIKVMETGKCHFPEGITFKPDGENELDPCRYEEIERYKNVTVSVRRCKKCGHIDLAWFQQDNTEEEPMES